MGKKKICISYSQDDLAFVTWLVDALRKSGETVWFDRHIRSGTQGGNTFVMEMNKADVLIVVLSDTSVVSAHVMDEVAVAMDLEKTIIPVKIRECAIPMRLRRYQYFDFTGDRQWAFDTLVADIVGDVIEIPMTVPRPTTEKSILSKGKGLFSGFSLGNLFGKFRGITGKVTGAKEGNANKETDWEFVREPETAPESGAVEEWEGSEEMEAGDGDKGGLENKTTSPKPKTGILAHSIPTKMQLQNTHRCIIRIGFDEVTIIKDFPERNREIVVKKDIRVSDVMEVEFLPNPHFEITALNNIKQPVDAYEHTEWNFDVMPKTVGEFPLTFKISIFLPNGSKEMILRESVSVITEAVPSGEVFIPSELMTLGEYYKTLNKKLKIITLFLASSSELADDRRAFEILIGRKNKNLIKENIYLELIIWEDFLDAMSASRLQDEYNKAITGCDVFISLFYTKVGKYTEEEFLRALDAFKMNKSPLIYTYFKDTDVKQTSLVNFQQRLSDMGHFYTRFKDTDDLNYKFGEQIVKFLPLIK